VTRPTATINAFAVAALVPAVLWAVAELVRTGDVRGLALVIVFLPYSIVATLLVAVPLFLAFNWLRLVNLWSSLAGGIIVGAVVAAAIRYPPLPSELLITCALGLAAALSFWITRHFLETKPSHANERAP
jgi:hypothetical protein